MRDIKDFRKLIILLSKSVFDEVFHEYSFVVDTSFDKFNPSILGVSEIIFKQLWTFISSEVRIPFIDPYDLNILTSALVSIP